MSRDVLVQMAKRTIAHARAETAPQADGLVEVPATNYYDPERWALEMERIFERVPLMMGFSCELAAPGAYRALEVAGTPVLMVRGADGEMRAFVNMCSHRGAIVVEEGSGTARRFACPYHAWTYDQEGALVGILDRELFGDLDTSCYGLTSLPCAERAGLIWVCLSPDAEMDLDRHLCGYGEMLPHLGLAECTMAGRQSVDGPNWKVAYDGYLDFYHLPILHKKTFGPDYNNKAIYDAWGPHQRVTSPDHRILIWADQPDDEWSQLRLTSGVWTIFPHVSIARFDVGEGLMVYMVSQLFPGADADSSVTIQNFLAMREPTEEEAAEIEKQMDFLMGVVRDEDYYTGLRIQRSVKTGAKSHFLFGRNEAGGQRFHGWVDDLVAAENQAATNSLFDAAEVAHQS